MNISGNFRARLGSKVNSGFLSQTERLTQIETGISPFVTGTELPENSSVFFGRAQIMHDVLSVLRNPNKPGCVSLLGERRMGKSSLLNQIFVALGKEEGLVTILGSTQGWSDYTPAAFFSDLYRTIASVLSTGEPTDLSSLSPVTDYPGFRDFIRQYTDRYRFILILDEFETMAGDPKFNGTFFANLRHLGSTPQFRFGYLLASRRPLSELRQQDKGLDSSSFWNIFGIPHVVSVLHPKDMRELIREPWQRSLQGTPLWPEAMEKLEELVGAYPALLQMVLDRMWTACAGGYELDPDEVRRGLWGYFDGLWRHRSEEEKDLLLKIVDAGLVPDNKLLWDLRSRGLITKDGRLFSKFFEYFAVSEYAAMSSLPDHGDIGSLDRFPLGLKTGLDFLVDIVKRVVTATITQL
uniref:AAA ATPase domain-containing protein n=1 Tax=Candidatus Kentrum sp. TUN TaxID=2126343 RepID=A0A451AN67_9GAMM|nr:MAG: AAA ATPase domain-containing protein [Candidatus Kentron sp. TUN]VFK67480.1 MAG: AAA ATPase domain-containing protein [Candidatus Kentron sp. TUN]